MSYRPARTLSAKVAVVLLALQVVFAPFSQITPAQARAATQTTACAEHGHGKQGSPGSHTCCHAGACQCHCGQVAADLLTFNHPPAPTAVPATRHAGLVTPRIDELLRPPIA